MMAMSQNHELNARKKENDGVDEEPPEVSMTYPVTVVMIPMSNAVILCFSILCLNRVSNAITYPLTNIVK